MNGVNHGCQANSGAGPSPGRSGRALHILRAGRAGQGCSSLQRLSLPLCSRSHHWLPRCRQQDIQRLSGM